MNKIFMKLNTAFVIMPRDIKINFCTVVKEIHFFLKKINFFHLRILINYS